jgi:UDPglucose--hexose-1-phosphate uridylyltransferase
MMHKRTVEYVDGRRFILYGRDELAEPVSAPPSHRRGAPKSAHLRWHVLRGEWVAYTGQGRDRDALGATPEDAYEDLPAGDYDIAVFEEPFPALTKEAIDPPLAIVETRTGRGVCEVVAFSQDPSATLGGLPLSHVELLLQVWADRYRSLGALPDVKYVFPFEERGVEAGLASPRPKGQLHAQPGVEPVRCSLRNSS